MDKVGFWLGLEFLSKWSLSKANWASYKNGGGAFFVHILMTSQFTTLEIVSLYYLVEHQASCNLEMQR